MSHLFTEINKLLIEGKSRVEIFTYRPENVDREALGSLFVLGEIFIRGRPEANDLFVLNAMASVLKREYYTTPYYTPAVNLEEALKAVNAAFPQINASTSPVEVQALVGVLNNDVLHIARHGHPEVFLVRQERWLNITRNQNGATTPARGKKRLLFNNIISGKVQAGDTIILTTADLLPYLREEKVRKRLMQQPFDEAAAYLQRQVSNLRNDVSAALLKLDIHAQHPLEKPLNVYDFDDSNDEALATPPLSAAPASLAIAPAPPKAIPRLTLNQIAQKITGLKNQLADRSSNFTHILRSQHKQWARKLQRFTPRPPALPKIDFRLKPQIAHAKLKYAGLAAVVIVILMTGVWGFSAWQGQVAQQNTLKTLIASFNEARDHVRLLGLSTSAADWQTLNTLISQVSDPETSQNLENEVRLLRQELTGTEELSQINALIPFKDLAVRFLPLGLIKINGELAVYDTASILRAGAEIGAAPRLTPLPVPVEQVKAVTAAADQPILLLNSLYLTQSQQFDLATGQSSPLALRKLNDQTTLKDADWYRDWLYILDATEKQILRYNIQTPSITPRIWLENEARAVLNTPLAMAIDGNIFVADRQAGDQLVIYRFNAGQLQKTYELPAVEAQTVTQLATLSGDLMLYILDASQGKIIALDKSTGQIKQRLTHEALSNALDILALDQNTVAVLTREALYQVAIPR